MAIEAQRVRAERLRRAAAHVEQALAGIAGVATAGDSLGWMWSSDVDVFVTGDALEPACLALAAAGHIALDPLLERLTVRRDPGTARHFAVLDGTAVLAALEVATTLWNGGPGATRAVLRAVPSQGVPRLLPADAARRRLAKLAATRRPTLRGAIELRALIERGDPLPARRDLVPALRHHGALEAALAGPGPLAAEAASSRPRVNLTWARARVDAAGREARSLRRRRQVRIAFCGIDGAGKSTQVERLIEALTIAGVPARASWTRIGNRASSPVTALANVARRLLRSGPHSFQATRGAAGRDRSRPDALAAVPELTPPVTRRGPLGWGWALAVTVDYLLRARAARRAANGSVLVLDRALPDALVELEYNYGVALRLALQRRLLKRLTPAPHMTFYLRLPGAVAKARKDDVFTVAELDMQARRYEALLERLPRVVALDAVQPRDALALEVLHTVAAGSGHAVGRSSSLSR